MIEYAIVLAFGVVILMQGGNDAPVKQVAKAIKDYHEHYSYAMSIAYIPDCDYQLALDKSATLNDITVLTGSATVGFDRCVDWSNPEIPAVTIDPSLTFITLSSAEDAIGDILKDAFKSAVDGYLPLDGFSKPADFLGDMLGFSPSDFF